MTDTQPLIIALSEIDQAALAWVGGKGASLGELTRIGLPVPTGFCVTTRAYARMAAQADLEPLVAALARVPIDSVDALVKSAGRIRSLISTAPIPVDLASAITTAYRRLGAGCAVAVRSSATAEDLPTASFAGMQESYLNLSGTDAVLDAVRRCWASLWTGRAVFYRARNRIPHTTVQLAVVVQRLVPAEISGVLFTADMATGDRGVCSIEATFGLGEALVSGRVNPDTYRLQKDTGALLETRVADKVLGLWPAPRGGTELRPISEDRRRARTLDAGLLGQLASLARRVEDHFGAPQDLEWCIAQGQLFLVQARPITSLFPLAEPRPHDAAPHVYFSVGHAQVNTAALHPMSVSLFHELFTFGDAVTHAAGRVYIDLTPVLHNRLLRVVIPEVLDALSPGVKAELRQATERPGFASPRPGASIQWSSLFPVFGIARGALRQLLRHDLDQARVEYEAALAARSSAWQAAFAEAEPGLAQLHLARQQLNQMAAGLLPLFLPVLLGGAVSLSLIHRLTHGRVEPRTVDALTRGLSGNVTTDMILALGDLADLARERPNVARCLQESPDATALDSVRRLPGAEHFLDRWNAFIQRYGHRCPTENDFALPRWREDPTSLVTMLVGMLGPMESGTHRRRFAAAGAEAAAAQKAILACAPRWQRPLLRALIRRVRTYLALREHHRFAFSKLFQEIRLAIVEAARTAVAQHQLGSVDVVWFLTLSELMDLLDGRADPSTLAERISGRKQDRAQHAQLVAPRLMTSTGEILRAPSPGSHPAGALIGVAASAGVVEGVARVILDPGRETLSPGEILVAPFTDPGWTPLFVQAGGLVMEVGGMLTHGSVVAREYGLPAVVGVEGATRKIRTGQRVRVDGDHGHVYILNGGEP